MGLLLGGCIGWLKDAYPRIDAWLLLFLCERPLAFS
jgi:hypothetical protein